MDWDSFFTVHSDLPREGPGEAGDVAWALALAGVPEGAAICDAGAGSGGDVAALLALPGARVLAIDSHPGFVAQMRARFAGEARVVVEEADMAALARHPAGPFDLIWCAGALYFLGLEAGLARMAGALKPGGVLAFSEPCVFVDAPSKAAVGFWEGYPARDAAGIGAAVAAAGYESLGARALGDAAWEAYYGPMEARIAALRPGADAALTAMLEVCAAEAALWRWVRGETGYLLTVARWKG
ncbi:class I SAM-dependent methyltransferase [Paragemmobacter ruber]|uniref:Methyltransferase domain-containing protein n=1 Tax=Paragemmobacter ruber TaxID=1985673 RepID=A0ABW9Y8P0_9RHOB|nr:class I SAM-dependent methyltransferase [Rhodobacter ruber]NBE08519.1 methyltransferase domain-containing protein [Rhodobacter ruber]